MSPFSVTLPQVADKELGPLLIHLAEAGYRNPVINPVSSTRSPGKRAGAKGVRADTADLPRDWRVVLEKDGESYQWPEVRDRYSRYRVFVGTTRSEGAVHIGLGETIRERRWGRDRKYVVAFLSSGSPQQPLAEFVAADDYSETQEFVAVIRGSDTLPQVYQDHFRTQIYSERVVHPGAWNKVVVVARENDSDTMLNHALVQGRRRYAAR
jgi:hypothetical protein